MRFGKLLVVALAVTTSAFAADPFVGTWKLHEPNTMAKAGQSPSNRTMTYEANAIRAIIQGDGITGTDHIAIFFNGKEYPADTSQIVRNTGADSVISCRPDPN